MKPLHAPWCGRFSLMLAFGTLLATGCTSQQTYNSPDRAVDALVQAVRDNRPDEVKKVLGPEAQDIISSGDDVADANAREKFLKAYDEKHHLEMDNEGRMTLVVGNDAWPLPIPLVKDDEKDTWSWDTKAGKDEVVNRRIGRNELDVIEVCKAIVDGQKEYAVRDPNGDGVPEYAEKFLSDPGQKNGLFWPTEEGETPSPLGPLVAAAVDEGYTRSANSSEPHPFHGYCYRMLKSQGPNAPGGAMDYMINGKMIGGFAVVAYPADYGNSGVMTFIVNHQGIVYQQDLGEDTERDAKAMQSFDPGPGWMAEAGSTTEQPSVSRPPGQQ